MFQRLLRSNEEANFRDPLPLLQFLKAEIYVRLLRDFLLSNQKRFPLEVVIGLVFGFLYPHHLAEVFKHQNSFTNIFIPFQNFIEAD